jgi:hypothetical protein
LVVKPDVALASNVTVGVMSSVGGGGGVGGVGAGGVGADGAEATAPEPPPPPHPNSGAVMPMPNAIKISRRFGFADACEDSTSSGTSFALIDWHPSIIFSPIVLLCGEEFFVERILSKGRKLFR